MHEVPGGMGQCIVIENDFKEELHESVKPHGDLSDLQPKRNYKKLYKMQVLLVWVVQHSQHM